MSSGVTGRPPIPPGTVSTIRGHYQGPALTWLTRLLVVLGLLGAALPGDARIAVATATVAGVVAAPLLRIAWLVFRWVQEHDTRFVVIGLALLAVVGTGAVLAAAGVG